MVVNENDEFNFLYNLVSPWGLDSSVMMQAVMETAPRTNPAVEVYALGEATSFQVRNAADHYALGPPGAEIHIEPETQGAIELRDIRMTLQWLDLVDPAPIASSWVIYYNAAADELFGSEVVTSIFTKSMANHPGAFLYDFQARVPAFQVPKNGHS